MSSYNLTVWYREQNLSSGSYRSGIIIIRLKKGVNTRFFTDICALASVNRGKRELPGFSKVTWRDITSNPFTWPREISSIFVKIKHPSFYAPCLKFHYKPADLNKHFFVFFYMFSFIDFTVLLSFLPVSRRKISNCFPNPSNSYPDCSDMPRYPFTECILHHHIKDCQKLRTRMFTGSSYHIHEHLAKNISPVVTRSS